LVLKTGLRALVPKMGKRYGKKPFPERHEVLAVVEHDTGRKSLSADFR
jgi:hypothetical protein